MKLEKISKWAKAEGCNWAQNGQRQAIFCYDQ
jgi:hypothetical protein